MIRPLGPSQSSNRGDLAIDQRQPAFDHAIWEHAHPRRDQVDDRLQKLDQRINRELKDGDLTDAQARQLRKEVRQIRREERTMAEFDHGHITRAEQEALNQQANAVSRQLGREAETQWERDHPRRYEVNNRLQNLDRRITRELKEGELTQDRARQLRKEVRQIRREERTMAGFDHGHITPAEQEALNRQEDALSRQVG